VTGAATPDRRRFACTWGAEMSGPSGARFRLWAPNEEAVTLRIAGEDRPMAKDADGWFERVDGDAAAGAAYAYVLGDGTVVPDPASRCQQGDVHGPSVLVDPTAYRWEHADWLGRAWEETVITEIHVGTFTPEGTFRAAIERLPHLAETGVTAVEVMPVAQFSGNRGWGYDGVLLYAPHTAYGTPDDFKAFIDAAHGLGLMVFLDVVFNHFGPDGNYLHAYAKDFFHADRHTPWGDAIAYEKPPVRRFFIENALYWLEEFHLDGLRLDAVDHVLDDESDTEILIEIAREIRARITDRPVHLATEDNRNITRLHERGPDGEVVLHTAEWNDDIHNVVHVIATGETEGYYVDFAEHHWEKFARALAEGYAFQGEISRHGGDTPRGEPSAHLPPTAFVDFIQNHDQVGNRAFGERLIDLAEGDMVRALTAILLLSPHIPLLFMGEEYGETRPFCFFTDFHGDLADAVREGRRREFRHFAAFQGAPEEIDHIPDPNAETTFAASRLDWAKLDTDTGRAWNGLVRELLALRQARIVPLLKGAGGNCGTVVPSEEGVIAVDWTLAGGRLQLRANLSAEPMAMPDGVGETIYRLVPDGAPEAPGKLAAHSVVVTISEAGR